MCPDKFYRINNALYLNIQHRSILITLKAIFSSKTLEVMGFQKSFE